MINIRFNQENRTNKSNHCTLMILRKVTLEFTVVVACRELLLVIRLIAECEYLVSVAVKFLVMFQSFSEFLPDKATKIHRRSSNCVHHFKIRDFIVSFTPNSACSSVSLEYLHQ